MPAAATGYAMSCWITEIEAALRRILAGNVLAEIADPGALARAVSAGFIGLQLYDGVDHAGADEALAALTSLAAIIDAVDDLGPVARTAVNSAIRAGSRKATRPT
ncbi:hypothetical protein [Rudaeicoccus suwonensis]|uniref:hypothetical protein n=1 Tax=Rudaeicoccus suwonensis TaxID=657409 RepID=UPI00119EFEDA|nr:hypothetical protein [Rudaeicoccus suwonensis]